MTFGSSTFPYFVFNRGFGGKTYHKSLASCFYRQTLLCSMRVRVVARRQRELRAFMAKGRRERRAQRQMRMRMEVDSGEQDPILVWMEVAKPLPPGDGLQDERERDTPGSRERPSQTWCWGPTPEKGRSPCVKRNLGREIEWQVKDSGDGGVERGVNGRMVPVRCSPVAAADHDHEGLSCGVPGAQQVREEICCGQFARAL